MKRDNDSRECARKTGLLYYFSTVMCKAGHSARRRTSTGVCTECEKGYITNYKSGPKYAITRRSIAKRQRLTLRGRAYEMMIAARGRARQYGLEFDLDTWDVELRLQRMVCEATGLPLSLERTGETKYNPWGPSLDRKDSTKGYTRDNVQLVCIAYNVAKGEWPESVLLTLVRALAKR